MQDQSEIIDLGRWTEAGLDGLLRSASGIVAPGDRIAFLSEHLLGTPYGAGTLAGCPGSPEAFVINLGAVDCFTFIDYVEALRLSSSFEGFRENLRRVRYRSGVVGYETRNHFFSDWRQHNAEHVKDVTEGISPGGCRRAQKVLNRRSDGTLCVPGIPPARREILWVPTEALAQEALARLRNGDYAGIYAGDEGLDVTHVGIIIVSTAGVRLRHASSRQGAGAVLDEDLPAYLAGRPGLTVLRPLP